MSVVVYIDGVDVTGVVLEGSVTRRLNRPAEARIRMRCQDAYVGTNPIEVGNRLRIDFQPPTSTTEEIWFHGFILGIEDDGDENTCYSEFTAQDPMELWQWRPVRDDDGDFTKPDIVYTYQTGPEILEVMLMNSEGDTTAQGNQAISPPSDAEGPLFLTLGSFPTDGVSLEGAPTDWPMTVAELFDLLISTGELDAVITPTDPGGGVMGEINAYNGNYGTDLTGSISFDYATGERNVRAFRRATDGSTLVTKYWLYGGPRVQTFGDPAGDQHWCFNVQGFDPGLAEPPGGQSVDANNDPLPDYTDNALGERIYNSRQEFGVRMEVRIYDADSENCQDPVVSYGRELYRRLWQTESWLRAYPRDLVHITPVRGAFEFGAFDIGDLVTVNLGTLVRGGISGGQRIYGYTISWDSDGVLALGELQTSSDQEQ